MSWLKKIEQAKKLKRKMKRKERINELSMRLLVQFLCGSGFNRHLISELNKLKEEEEKDV